MGRKSKKNHYSIKNIVGKDVARAQASSIPVHFKNTLETANVLRGMSIQRALKYLENVISRKECVPFKIHKGGIGKCGQAKQFNTVIGRWPKKSAIALQSLLKNAISNAEYYERDCERYYIHHIQVNKAPVTTRRTYRAHGRINPYVRHLSHIQVILAENTEQ